MKQAIWALALFTASAFGADFTGKYAGKALVRENGETHEYAMNVELKQEGKNVTGTAGPGLDKMLPIGECKVENNKIHFVVAPPGDDTIVFDLVLEGDHLTGDLSSPTSTEKTGTLDVTRAN